MRPPRASSHAGGPCKPSAHWTGGQLGLGVGQQPHTGCNMASRHQLIKMIEPRGVRGPHLGAAESDQPDISGGPSEGSPHSADGGHASPQGVARHVQPDRHGPSAHELLQLVGEVQALVLRPHPLVRPGVLWGLVGEWGIKCPWMELGDGAAGSAQAG